MKKTAVSVLFFILLNVSFCHAAESTRRFKGGGEVTTVDPVYSQITVKHRAIQGFAGGGTTEFYVSDASTLKGIAKGDLVEFDLTDNKGDVRLDKITKTGVALPKEEDFPLGQAVHDTLRGTGEILQTVTSPLPPLSEAVGGAMESTASVTDPKMVDGELKQKASF